MKTSTRGAAGIITTSSPLQADRSGDQATTRKVRADDACRLSFGYTEFSNFEFLRSRGQGEKRLPISPLAFEPRTKWSLPVESTRPTAY